MKVIGLLGGTSWVSTREYYTLLNKGASERLGGSHSCQLILHSFDLAVVSELLMGGQIADVAKIFVSAAKGLEVAGADCILICANSFHAIADDVQAQIGIPILNLVECVGAHLQNAGVKLAGLLGTFVTMDGVFYPERIAQYGVDLIIPGVDTKDEVHRTIAEELTRDIFTEPTRSFYINEMHKLQARGAEAVIMGCTEIPLLVSQDDVAVRLVDTTKVHVNAALRFAFGE